LVVTGALWFAAAALAFRCLTEQGRRRGSLELEP
jgi:hypothetical protein